ncbi:helix-turn-helix transcriptional regulator [Aestuariicella hydrocarbonica]|uniref:Helix-turn-helix transcriptional regulator n=1 Tax=Pseudomaricurvus hydrocarbonicus TaxID=1470433 RepID=A0A9E5MM29_9GAMM|nr:helix-turn-helix transcriptional regulator [Aestuariicella hydrocarbonica]NHO66128.1 helix-turn-helix transcriptional regulator [Aestuariicella hydrocarbonica]
MSFLERVLPSLYQSAEEPESWTSALDQIKQEMQVASVVVQKLKLCHNRLSQEWVVRDSVSTEMAESHDCLVNNDENPRLNVGSVPMSDSAVIQDDGNCHDPEFRALQQRLHMLGLGRPIILGVKYSQGSSLCMLLHRYSDDARDFSEEHVNFLHRLTPHLKQTVSLSEKLGQFQTQADVLTQSMEQLNSAMLFLDRTGEIRWANTRGREVLQRSPHLSMSGSKLRCSSSKAQRQLVELLEHVSSPSHSGERFVTTLGSQWDNPLQILALPIYATGASSGSSQSASPCIALYVTEQDTAQSLSAVEIVKLFGLTPAEARLAIALYYGASPNDYAVQQGIAVGTARIQLKNIFAKLGINRQPELVRVIGSSIAATIPTRLNQDFSKSILQRSA